MKKILALLLAMAMVFALCACGAAEEPAVEEAAPAAPAAEAAAPAAEAAAPAAGEVTWADYQEYLIETAGANAPDLDEFKGQVYSFNDWDSMPLDQSPWDQLFTTVGISTWEEFQQGIVKEAAVMGTASDEASGEPSEEPAA